MKASRPRNSPIDMRRIRGWANEFAGYRHPISEDRIRDWIAQFDDGDRDISARILDCVDYFSHDRIAAAYREVLRGLDGWHIEANRRAGRWRFVAFSASAGESGDSMLHKFRHANNLASAKYNELFIYKSDIVRQELGPDDTVVLVDDFVGTGDQVCKAWKSDFGELLANVGRYFLVVVAAPRRAVERVHDETGLEVVPHVFLERGDNVFARECSRFATEEKNRLLHYCGQADAKAPQGHGECGLLVVFSHSCPNNTIPILHVESNRWEGLFRRYN